jgi:hypothetical protein
MRDARVLTDTLLANEPWTLDTLDAYRDERRERMRRLRIPLAVNQLSYGFGPEGAQRRVRIRAITRADPGLGLARAANMAGPWGAARRRVCRRNLLNDPRGALALSEQHFPAGLRFGALVADRRTGERRDEVGTFRSSPE